VLANLPSDAITTEPFPPKYRFMSHSAAEPSFPTVAAIAALESRQDEVLRQLDDLEQQVLSALKTFGDSRWSKVLGVEVATAPAGAKAA